MSEIERFDAHATALAALLAQLEFARTLAARGLHGGEALYLTGPRIPISGGLQGAHELRFLKV